MDPLSLTVSILTLVGVSTQCVKLLKSLVTLKSARRLIADLDEELSNLRRDVFAIQNLFHRQSKELTLSGDSVALADDTIVSVIGCLEKANNLVIELNCSLSPLLALYLRSDCVAIQKWIRWLREESKLNDFKEKIYNVRIRLITTLGILDWYDLLFQQLSHATPNLFNIHSRWLFC